MTLNRQTDSEPVEAQDRYRSHRLRSYIAPAAPATRAPCDGTESPLRIEFGFTPRWYRRHCGIDFGERWHTDPRYRHTTGVLMRQTLNERFPVLQLGGPDPATYGASLDGVYGALLVSMIYGVGVEYYPGNWPAAQHHDLSDEAARRLQPPVLDDSPVFSRLMKQMDAIEQAFGCIEGYLNWQGVLNNAYRLRGQAIFTDMMADPGLAGHLFECVTETMIEGMRRVYARQAKTGVMVRHATVSNCMVNMLSPELYSELLFPYDQRISEAFDYFGIHNCAWNADPYVETYARIAKLGYIDMGMDSDLARAKKLCPDARRALMYKPTDLENKSPEALRQDLRRIRDEYAPCDIVMADIEDSTPDARVLEFAAMARELEREMERG